MTTRYTWKHLIITLVGMAVLVAVMFAAIIMRDYNVVFKEGEFRLESKIPVLGAPGFSLDNGVEGKLTVRISDNGAVAYDVRVSRFENMMFSRIYRTALPRKEIGLMKSNKTYYVKVRAVVNKPGTTRKINGNWSQTSRVRIK